MIVKPSFHAFLDIFSYSLNKNILILKEDSILNISNYLIDLKDYSF